MSATAADPGLALAGVMGWPIAHSKSPRLFGHWFKTLEVVGHYVPLAVTPTDFADVLRALPKAGFRGVNVTVPHKEAALAAADQRTEAARAIGAANLLRFDADSGVIADNSDAYGFVENLWQSFPRWRPTAGPALVLGAGGAARAVVHALLAAGVTEIRVVNRSPERAEALCAAFGPFVVAKSWDRRAGAAADVATLVNATSLGMMGSPALEMPLDAAPPNALVTDLVYAPLETPLLAAARLRGMPAVDGLGMLLHQARPAFRTWFGVDPPVDQALRAACLGGQP
ncbi:MAG: shikimate dehydrogenase [Pseudomonadota bacterium]